MLGRREFVTIAAGGLSAACASLAVTPLPPAGGRIRMALSEWPRLTAPGGFARIRVDGTDTTLYILTLDDGSYAAVSPVCKHRGCTVEIGADRLRCPCHGSQYSREGAVLQGPTRAPLDRYVTHVTADGVLVIHLEERTR